MTFDFSPQVGCASSQLETPKTVKEKSAGPRNGPRDRAGTLETKNSNVLQHHDNLSGQYEEIKESSIVLRHGVIMKSKLQLQKAAFWLKLACLSSNHERNMLRQQVLQTPLLRVNC